MKKTYPISLLFVFVLSVQAGGIPDIYEDGCIDLLDLAVLARAWLTQPGDDNWNPACDISEPSDNVINRLDLVVLVDDWLECKNSSIIYQVEYCDLAAGETSAIGAESGDLRFSVTVQGNYIYFEDVMVANCCAVQIWLQMTVVGNTITIYEHENTPYPCTCICDNPVTATLGPFEWGTYTLEVYEDFGGFIGSTTVIIE